jgi:signal transduction histidine kinase
VEPVYAWLRRHPRLADGVLALILLAPGMNVFASSSFRLSAPADQAGLIVISLVLAGLVVVRRRYAAATFAFAIAACSAQVALGMRPGAVPLVPADAASIVLLYTLAAYRPRRVSLYGLAACLALIAVAAITWPPAPLSPRAMLFGALAAGVPAVSAWALGDSMAYRRAHNSWLEQRARQAEAERDAKAQLAAAAERSRIAREMHDIIAHNLSVIVGLADGGRYAAAASPERSGQALGAIASTGREALGELRRLLGVLRENGGSSADLAPQPGLADLDALLRRVGETGLPVRCTVRGDVRGLSEGRQLTVYRIVQEALTNTLKHAGPAATAEVTLECADGAVDVQITDTGSGGPAGSRDGQGLHGMRERAGVYDGTLRAGPAPGGGWRVEAHLPAPVTAVA